MKESPALAIVSSVKTAFEDEMQAIYASATPEDHAATKAIITNSAEVTKDTITPTMAAILYVNFNGRNRDFSIERAREYEAAMRRGEWKETHQGIALDPEGLIIDGQHRMAAIALSGAPVRIQVTRNQSKTIIDAIDQSKQRKAHETLTLNGVTSAVEKARIARATIDYSAKVGGHRNPKFSMIQIANYVSENDHALTDAIEIAKASIRNIAEPCLTENDTSVVIHLMQLGGWPRHLIPAFVTTLQAGVEQRENGVIVPAAKLMFAAKRSDKKNDRLTRDRRIATILKAAKPWALGTSQAKFYAVKAREKLTDFHADEEIRQLAKEQAA